MRGKSSVALSNPTIEQGVEIPCWLLWGSIGAIVGLIFGAPLLVSTQAGADWVRKKTEKKWPRK